MKLILDTSVLISALIKDSVTRKILLFPFFEIFIPEYAFEEIDAHKDKISKLSGLTKDEIDIVLNMLLDNISIVPAKNIEPYLKDAEKLIGSIDHCDIPFIALSLSIENDGIWSNDKHFEKVKGIKIWKTQDLLKQVKKLK